MISRSQIKMAIDDWSEWQKSTAVGAINRSISPRWPKNLALALIGVRRSGKTYSSLAVARERGERVLYFNFEDPIVALFNDVRIFDEIISVYSEYFGSPPQVIVFDEIQNVTGWERWVRKTVDTKKWPLIISGSSAKLLSSELATSISGRCVEHKIWPLSYKEFLDFSESPSTTPLDHMAALRAYMTWGGFPAVVLEKDLRNKKVILEQYVNDILLKDIAERHQIRSQAKLNQLVVFALTNIASDFSYGSVSRAFDVSTTTVQEYCEHLNDAFLLFEVHRYHRNLKVQARDSKKIYAIDPGIRRIKSRSPSDDSGKIAENLVYIELLRRGESVYYYRNKGEVDFITVEGGKPTRAIQVCFSNMEDETTYKREVSSLLECLVELKLGEGFILTLSREETVKLDDKRIQMVPIYKFLLAHDYLR